MRNADRGKGQSLGEGQTSEATRLPRESEHEESHDRRPRQDEGRRFAQPIQNGIKLESHGSNLLYTAQTPTKAFVA